MNDAGIGIQNILFYLGLVLALAVFVEGTVEYMQDMLPEKVKRYNKLIAAAMGVIVSVLYGADLLAIFGYQAQYAYVGSVITGIICGRGSNYVNDFVSWLQAFTNKANAATRANQAIAISTFTELQSSVKQDNVSVERKAKAYPVS